MVSTRDFRLTIIERVQQDPEFAAVLLCDAAHLVLSGEPEVARVILRDLVNATLGFEQLALVTEHSSKSQHRMLSPKGNPGMNHLASIFLAVRDQLQVILEVSHCANPA